MVFYVLCAGQTWMKRVEVRESESAPSIAALTDVFGASSPPPSSSSFLPPSSALAVSAAETDSLPA